MTRIEGIIVDSRTISATDLAGQSSKDITDAEGNVDVFARVTAVTGAGNVTLDIAGRVHGGTEEIIELTSVALAAVGLFFIGTISKKYQYLRPRFTLNSGTSIQLEVYFIYDK